MSILSQLFEEMFLVEEEIDLLQKQLYSHREYLFEIKESINKQEEVLMDEWKLNRKKKK